ncbi:MAG: hypothetical protein ACPG49_14525, partial [Chitinophagales bacterium]
AILHFVPIRYLYPSRTSKLMWLNVINTIVCMVSNAAVIWLYPEVNFWWTALSIGSILYFIIMGLHSTLTAKD